MLPLEGQREIKMTGLDSFFLFFFVEKTLNEVCSIWTKQQVDENWKTAPIGIPSVYWPYITSTLPIINWSILSLLM